MPACCHSSISPGDRESSRQLPALARPTPQLPSAADLSTSGIGAERFPSRWFQVEAPANNLSHRFEKPGVDVIKVLVRAGANSARCNNHGVSPLDLVQKRGLVELEREMAMKPQGSS